MPTILKSTPNNTSIFQCHLSVEQLPSSIISILACNCPQLSHSAIKLAITKGALWLTRGKHTQRLRRIKKELKIGDELHFYYNEKVLSEPVPQAKLIADLHDYSVWYKPFGMLSQGSKWSDHCTIARFAQTNLLPERSAFIVHRLDKAASGLILVAHSKKATTALSKMFEHHSLTKHYNIIVHGDHRKHNQPEIISTDIEGKSAKSTFTCLEYDEKNNVSLVDVDIASGRKHQIRIHAASIGFPVLGDRLHGIVTALDKINNLQLCAISLAFTCPLTGQAQQFQLESELMPQLNRINTCL